MGPSPILSITNTITIGTILNFNDGNKRHGLKNITCISDFLNSETNGQQFSMSNFVKYIFSNKASCVTSNIWTINSD